MKSFKVISLVLLVGVASQAYGMSWLRASKVPAVRRMAALTAAAAGLGGVTFAEGDKPTQSPLRLDSGDYVVVGSWWNPFTYYDYYEYRKLKWVDKSGKETYLPSILQTNKEREATHIDVHLKQTTQKQCRVCSKDDEAYHFVPQNAGVDPILYAKVNVEQQRYKKAAKTMAANLKGREKRRLAHPDSFMHRTAQENIFKNASYEDCAIGLDQRLLRPYFYTELDSEATLYNAVAKAVDTAIRADNEKARAGMEAEYWRERAAGREQGKKRKMQHEKELEQLLAVSA